jgi:hypothetical protein
LSIEELVKKWIEEDIPSFTTDFCPITGHDLAKISEKFEDVYSDFQSQICEEIGAVEDKDEVKVCAHDAIYINIKITPEHLKSIEKHKKGFWEMWRGPCAEKVIVFLEIMEEEQPNE